MSAGPSDPLADFTAGKEFDIPAGVDSLTLYVIVGPGSGKSAYLDNVKLVRIDENAADAI